VVPSAAVVSDPAVVVVLLAEVAALPSASVVDETPSPPEPPLPPTEGPHAAANATTNAIGQHFIPTHGHPFGRR